MQILPVGEYVTRVTLALGRRRAFHRAGADGTGVSAAQMSAARPARKVSVQGSSGEQTLPNC